MRPGATVWRCSLFSSIANASTPYYTETATATGIVVDGTPMVRLYTMLLPATGWHESEASAKAEARVNLIRLIGKLQAVADTMRDECLHASLTTEESGA